MRAGALAQDRLELAAWLGHEAAARATGLELDPDSRLPRAVLRERRRSKVVLDELYAWASGLNRFEPVARVRAAVAVGGHHLAELLRAEERAKAPRTGAGARTARELWDAAAAWAIGPADRAARRRLQALMTATFAPGGGQPRHAVIRAAAAVALDASLGRDRADWWPRSPRRQPRVEVLERDREVVREQLVPWALGLRDPLANIRVGGLDRIEVASPCPVGWADLAPTDDPRVRHCRSCALDVVDLAGLDRSAAERLLGSARGGLCVSLYRDAQGRILTSDCVSGLSLRLWGNPGRGRVLPRWSP